MSRTNEGITLAQGSGGELTSELLEQGVFRLLKNEHLNKKHDGALLKLEGAVAFATDSYIVSPIFFPGGNIGELAVNGTVNDLAMCGARAKYLSLSFIIEEGLHNSEFMSVVSSIAEAAEKAQVQIVTGDTKVVERGKGDKLFINTSGIGNIHPEAHIDVTNIRPGDAVIVSGCLASHGMAIMCQREGIEFKTAIRSDTRALHHEVLALIQEFGKDIHFLRDPTRGGAGTSLNEVARQAGIGIEIEEACLPVEMQVSAACEMLGIDPLYVANEGIFLAWVDKSASEAVLQKLLQLQPYSQASIIGRATREHAGQVVMRTTSGGRRVVPMPAGELLPRIC